MFTKAFKILGDRALAEDALSDAFVQIWKNIGKIDDPANSRSVVLAVTLAKNCAYALQREASESAAADAGPEGSGPEEKTGGAGASSKKSGTAAPSAGRNKNFNVRGMERALYQMSSSDIIKAVNKLGGVNKNIFILKYAFGFTERKTAKTLGEPVAGVGARLYKAQKKLRALILKNGRRDIE